MSGTYLEVEDKIKYIKQNSPLQEDISTKVMCIFCEDIFTLDECKILKKTNGEEIIVCPNSPKCEGTIHDFLIQK